jgi:hypothetical protein
VGHQELDDYKPSRTSDLYANQKYANGFVGELWGIIRAKQKPVETSDGTTYREIPHDK